MLHRPDPRRSVADAALERFGHVDILVLNAGGPRAGDPTTTSPQDIAHGLQLLTTTPIELANRLLPGMRERQWGRVVAILSWGVREPIPNLTLSNMGRGALAAWLKTASRWVAADGVTVNGVLPGRFNTPRIRELDEARATRESRPVEHVQREARTNVPARTRWRPG